MRLGSGMWDRSWAGRAAIWTTVASAWGRRCHLGFGVRRTWGPGVVPESRESCLWSGWGSGG